MFFLKLFFRDEGHLYANCLFYILTINPKCNPFQFFNRGIRMYIPILTGVLHGRRSFWDSSHIFLKNVLFEALFPRWKSPVRQFLLGILTIDPKFIFFQFFARDIRMFIPILRGIQNGGINIRKKSVLLLKKNCF